MDKWNENKEPQVKLKYFGIPKIMPYIRPYGKLILLMSLLLFVDSGIALISPLFQKYAIDNFVTPLSTDGLVMFAIVYVILIFFQ
ncbi:MAG: hypothetical protein IKM24_03030, partial [Clostridia bacterium]|nr:hypothetical protein [Clostridia bacterium]